MASGSQTQADGDKCFTELTACWDSAEEFSRLMEVEQRDSQKGANGLIKPSPSLVEYRRSRYQRAASAYKLVVLNLKKYKKDNSLSEAIIYRKSADHKRRDPGLGELLDRVGLLEGDL
ncbi:uncharacterized protein LAJ45_05930 [Morchella importuna]|uniref:uncharacterized protein n=1 Tax=Morchella importuna TaxID=1174673 RepID=UPI001E8CE163|nr:uncharacterized protein LAJ45_05930 [Morchella importuna]KAH8149778.1 hypothetical protein LAJ45_05930 [Morchella importuna]